MMLTKTEPFTLSEIEQLKEEFDVFIKTVIDIENKICSAGMNRHFEGEQILLEQGSRQSQIWGGSIDLESKVVDYNSFINIKPRDNNLKNDIQSETIREQYLALSNFFFQEVLS